ncbi:MAG: putative sugar nucleotidyl transferase [Gemmatimonadales bacterium]
MQLYLLDPPAPGSAWAPFSGVRPIAELRAGIWRIRERWEAVLQAQTVAILSDHTEGFHEGDEPPTRRIAPVDGPAIVAASWFAPAGTPVELESGLRRLTNEGETVAWLVPEGERWTAPTDEGPETTIDGLILHGAFDLVTALEALLPGDCADCLNEARDEVPDGSIVLGDPAEVVCLGASVEPGVVFDVRRGAVVVEERVEVRHGTRLEGPLYLGAGSRVLGGHLRTSTIGPGCSVNGEIASSVLLGYANKNHDGFLGHSVIGHWVNLGAGTTTSNLKNTYGPVHLEVAGERLETGRQFLGSLIADHVKAAIGTMLGTGTVVSVGANLFGGAPVPRYVPPFAWGNAGSERLTEEGFLKIAERVMPRRDVAFTEARKEWLRGMYRRIRG